MKSLPFTFVTLWTAFADAALVFLSSHSVCTTPSADYLHTLC